MKWTTKLRKTLATSWDIYGKEIDLEQARTWGYSTTSIKKITTPKFDD